MVDALHQKPNDLGVLHVAPASQDDPRVPLAEEFRLSTLISISSLIALMPQVAWSRKPELSIESPRTLKIHKASARLPVCLGDLHLQNISLVIPAIAGQQTLVRRDDFITLLAFAAEVGVAQDPSLTVSFQYRDQSTSQILAIEKENARRLRFFWVLVLSPDRLTPEGAIADLLTTVNQTNEKRLHIAGTTTSGFTIGNHRIWALDPNLAENRAYTVFPETIETLEVCQIKRQQNFVNRGYTWGHQGEEPLHLDYNLIQSAPVVRHSDREIQVRGRFNELISGLPGTGSCYNRTVQNLTAGLVAGNPGRSGESAASPNGSVSLANDQRVAFTNQEILQNLATQVVLASNNAQGQPAVTATLNTNSPAGSSFSANRNDHKIYNARGDECSTFGDFQNLGALIWTGNSNSGVSAGDTVYFVPGVRYSAGSGSTIPFNRVEAVFRNGTALSSVNIREAATNDILSFAEPANGELFFVVYGQERSAMVHYILKRITVTANSSGTVAIPSDERGCFAFIEGVTGRIDAPVRKGLNPNTTYKALVYYPPRSTESWQFQLKYPEYQGTGEIEFLNGAVVASRPSFFIHTQGGGVSVFQGDAAIRYSPISTHLPQCEGDRPWLMDSPCHTAGEAYPGPLTFRDDLPLIAGVGLASPTPGQKLQYEVMNTVHPRSIRAKVITGGGQTLGFRKPRLVNSGLYQAVCTFLVEKDGDFRLLVATHLSNGDKNVAFNTEQGTAIDLFRI